MLNPWEWHSWPQHFHPHHHHFLQSENISLWNEGCIRVKHQNFYRLVLQPASGHTHEISVCLSHEKKKRKKGALIWSKKNNSVIWSPELFVQATTKSRLHAEHTPWVQTSVCLLNGLSGQDRQRGANLCCCWWTPTTPAIGFITDLHSLSHPPCYTSLPSFPAELSWCTVSIGLDLLR